MADRVGFIVANEAARQSTALAVAGTTKATDLRILLAVHSLTVHWSRLQDRQSLAQVAAVAGLSAGHDEASQHNTERRVAKSLARLAALGAVTYAPSRGRGRLSTIGIPLPKGVCVDPLSEEEKGSRSARKGVPGDPKRGLCGPPLTEASSRKPYTRGVGSAERRLKDGSALADLKPGRVPL